MSVLCAVCFDTVCQPNSLWYAAVRTQNLTCWICGDCLSRIPKEERIPTNVQNDREVTFGPMRADVNCSGRYQMSGARQMEPRFWVPFETLERYYASPCELMSMFFPIVRMERCLLEMLAADRAGVWPPWPWEIRTRDYILMECSHEIRAFLRLKPQGPDEEPPLVSIDGTRLELKPEHVRLAGWLWQAICDWEAISHEETDPGIAKT